MSRFVLFSEMQDMKKYTFSFPGVFFFFSLFSYVYVPGYPIRIVLLQLHFIISHLTTAFWD